MLHPGQQKVFAGMRRHQLEHDAATTQRTLFCQIDPAMRTAAQFHQNLKITDRFTRLGKRGRRDGRAEQALAIEQ